MWSGAGRARRRETHVVVESSLPEAAIVVQQGTASEVVLDIIGRFTVIHHELLLERLTVTVPSSMVVTIRRPSTHQLQVPR